MVWNDVLDVFIRFMVTAAILYEYSCSKGLCHEL